MDNLMTQFLVAAAIAMVALAVVLRPRYEGRHRAPGRPRMGNGKWRDWLRGHPDVLAAITRDEPEESP